MLVCDSRTSSAKGAFGRHERHESAGMRLHGRCGPLVTAVFSGLRLGLLTVARQYLLAGAANLGPVGLQTAKNSQHVVGIDLQLCLAKPRHIRMASRTFLIICLSHR
jgi:hypothetical protein